MSRESCEGCEQTILTLRNKGRPLYNFSNTTSVNLPPLNLGTCFCFRIDQSLGKPGILQSKSCKERERQTISARVMKIENQVRQILHSHGGNCRIFFFLSNLTLKYEQSTDWTIDTNTNGGHSKYYMPLNFTSGIINKFFKKTFRG